jgi:hypothetical protein
MMTEELEKWVIQRDSNAAAASQAKDRIILEQYCEEAYFWLSAFVREVEQRVGPNTGEIYTADAFYDLVREFNLGEDK